jgi:hypothetical protein
LSLIKGLRQVWNYAPTFRLRLTVQSPTACLSITFDVVRTTDVTFSVSDSTKLRFRQVVGATVYVCRLVR